MRERALYCADGGVVCAYTGRAGCAAEGVVVESLGDKGSEEFPRTGRGGRERGRDEDGGGERWRWRGTGREGHGKRMGGPEM